MTAPKVTIYTTPYCPYCHAAKALLKKKGVHFDEIDVRESQRLEVRGLGVQCDAADTIGLGFINTADSLVESALCEQRPFVG